MGGLSEPLNTQKTEGEDQDWLWLRVARGAVVKRESRRAQGHGLPPAPAIVRTRKAQLSCRLPGWEREHPNFLKFNFEEVRESNSP